MTDGARPHSLTLERLHSAVRELAAVDEDLRRVVGMFGPPPLWDRPQSFATLVYIILEQQVSLASARAAYGRLEAASPVTPEIFLTYDDETLKQFGFSRQKTGYARGLALAVLEGQIDITALNDMHDEDVRAALVRLKGIGNWSADIYLMEALLRPDIWPVGDLALASAVRQVKRLAATPAPDDLKRIGEAYRPWRAAAARIYWHYYLSTPQRSGRGSNFVPPNNVQFP